jgi:cytochrome oxidase assembly protein ShyY1
MRFHFRLVPFIACLLLAALGIALGQWQDRRAAGKLELQAQLDQRAVLEPLALGAVEVPVERTEYRPVRANGSWVAEWTVYLDNRPQQGRAGLYVLTPLKLAGSDMHVLVVRGWIPRNNQDRTKIAPYRTGDGEVLVTGIARRNPGKVMELGEPGPLKPQSIVQNVDVAGFARASGLRLQPFVVEQDAGPVDDGLVREWPAATSGVDKHKGYAFQWYALAAMAIIFFVVTGFKRGTKV